MKDSTRIALAVLTFLGAAAPVARDVIIALHNKHDDDDDNESTGKNLGE